MPLNIIVAHCKNGGIGFKNHLPWKIKSDLIKFRKLTTGIGNNAIIMGKNTWNSLPIKPLEQRDNLIISKSLSIDSLSCNTNYTNKNKNIYIFTSINSVLEFCLTKNYDDVWVIGGDQIYKEFINNYTQYIDKIYVTYIDHEYECDTFFPDIKINNNFISVKNEPSSNLYNNSRLKMFDIIYHNKDYHE